MQPWVAWGFSTATHAHWAFAKKMNYYELCVESWPRLPSLAQVFKMLRKWFENDLFWKVTHPGKVWVPQCNPDPGNRRTPGRWRWIVRIQKIMSMPPAQEPRSEDLPPDNVERSHQLLPLLPRRRSLQSILCQIALHNSPQVVIYDHLNKVTQYLGTFFKNTYGLGQYQWGPNKSSEEFGATLQCTVLISPIRCWLILLYTTNENS